MIVKRCFYNHLLFYIMQTSKTYNSGVDGKLIAIIGIVFSAVMILPALKGDWSVLLITLPIVAFVGHILFGTRYTITGNTLNVRAGFIINKDIDIETITAIEETDSILSAPANSLDRIEIFYNKFDSVIISPKNKAEFINDILVINGAVRVKYRG